MKEVTTPSLFRFVTFMPARRLTSVKNLLKEDLMKPTQVHGLSVIKDRLFQRRSGFARQLVVFTSMFLVCVGAFAAIPEVGTKAPDFTLSTPAGQKVQLSGLTGKEPVILVILREFPGYQCPYCEKQVHDFVEHAPAFAAKHTDVLLVYPGPPADLDAHAKDFLTKQVELPQNVQLVIDPDYTVTNRYGLRWDAPHETAYPSTFILDRKGSVIFEKVSHSHGDRISAEEILSKLP